MESVKSLGNSVIEMWLVDDKTVKKFTKLFPPKVRDESKKPRMLPICFAPCTWINQSIQSIAR